MTPNHLYEKLIEACEGGNVADVQDILEHKATAKEFLLQKAIEKDKSYLELLIPNFTACDDQALLMGLLQAAINLDDVGLVKQAIEQGAKVESLFLYAIIDLNSSEILQLLIENGFNIHTEKNTIVREWIGASVIGGWGKKKPTKHQLLVFIAEYYLDNPNEMKEFESLSLSDKSRLFRIGLDSNNFKMMKFAFMIGVNKNEALNSSLYRYYANHQENASSTHSTMFKNNKSANVDYGIIEYILNSNIKFDDATISNAVCFKYQDVLDALCDMNDLEYGYEMAYKYENDNLLEYFSNRGVSKEAQNIAKVKVCAIKGDIKELRQAVNDGANLEGLDKAFIAKVINENQVESLKYFNDLGVLIDSTLNELLNNSMHQYRAYEAITYLIEHGFDITNVKNLPIAYKKKYPIVGDMWEKNFTDIFDYTIYLASELLPKLEGKEKENALGRIAELSSLPYVIKKSEEKSRGY